MAPEGPDLVLAADVPHGEANVFVFHRLHIEADRRDGSHNFAQL